MDDTKLLRAIVVGFALLAPERLLAQGHSEEVASIKSTLAARYPDVKIVDIKPAPIASLYEVFTGKSIVYTDGTGNYMISGALIDTLTRKNVTEARVNELNAIDFSALPVQQAIRIVKGDGSRKLAVFTDPDCPHCRRLEENLSSVSDVTVYVFLFPLTRIHPDAERHAKAIWCSSNRAESWVRWMVEEKEPKETTCKGDPISALLELGRKLNVSGTPTLYFENGSRSVGAMSSSEIETRLTEAKKMS